MKIKYVIILENSLQFITQHFHFLKFIHNNPTWETTKLLLNGQIDLKRLWYIHRKENYLAKNKKEQNNDMCTYVTESGKHQAE